MKKEKANHIGTILLTILLTLTMPLNVLASTTNSGAITIQEQWADNVYNNFQTLLQDSLKVSIPKSEGDRIWNDYVDHAYSIWNLNENDLQSHYGHFRDYVGSQFQMEKNSDNTYNYNMSSDAQTFIQDSYNTYIQDNALSYVQCYIYSYNYLNSSLFANYAQYTTIKEYIKNANGLVFANYYSNNTGLHVYLYTFSDYNNVGFYGSVSNGGFTNVKVSYNWNEIIGITYRGGFGTVVRVEPDGSVVTPQRNVIASWTTIKNTASPQLENSGTVNVFTNTPKNEPIYVFNNLNAYKAYNSGSPQPYYQMSGYTGVIDPTGYNVPNTNSSYESIVNNIQSGWTAEEVLALVDRIMSQNGGSGSGSGGSSSDNPFGFLGRIGELLSQLVTGVGELLTGLVDGVVNVFLGAEDENGQRHGGLFGTIRDLISQLSTIFSTDISQFVSDIFGWLPSEIITLWTAGIMIAILFGILRIIRG